MDLIIELQYNATHTASQNNSNNPIVEVHSQIYYHLNYGRDCMSAYADAYIALWAVPKPYHPQSMQVKAIKRY